MKKVEDMFDKSLEETKEIVEKRDFGVEGIMKRKRRGENLRQTSISLEIKTYAKLIAMSSVEGVTASEIIEEALNKLFEERMVKYSETTKKFLLERYPNIFK